VPFQKQEESSAPKRAMPHCTGCHLQLLGIPEESNLKCLVVNAN